jgi:hypothetical protein
MLLPLVRAGITRGVRGRAAWPCKPKANRGYSFWLLVVTGARCPLTKPVVTAVELQATTEPHCSRGVQPGGIYVYVGAARADSRGSGVGLAPRPQALPAPAAALILYIFVTFSVINSLILSGNLRSYERSEIAPSIRGLEPRRTNKQKDSTVA